MDWVPPVNTGERSCRYWDHRFREEYYYADGGNDVELTVDEDCKTLEISGIDVDIVDLVGGPCMQERVDEFLPANLIQTTLKMWRRSAAIYHNSDPDNCTMTDTWTESFWKTMTGNFITKESFPLREVEDQDIELFEHSFKSPDPESLTRDSQIYANLQCNILSQAFFVTKSGYLGIGPPEIWVLLSGRAPFVLRPSGGKHTLVGDCYTHGIMNGEVFEGGE